MLLWLVQFVYATFHSAKITNNDECSKTGGKSRMVFDVHLDERGINECSSVDAMEKKTKNMKEGAEKMDCSDVGTADKRTSETEKMDCSDMKGIFNTPKKKFLHRFRSEIEHENMDVSNEETCNNASNDELSFDGTNKIHPYACDTRQRSLTTQTIPMAPLTCSKDQEMEDTVTDNSIFTQHSFKSVNTDNNDEMNYKDCNTSLPGVSQISKGTGKTEPCMEGKTSLVCSLRNEKIGTGINREDYGGKDAKHSKEWQIPMDVSMEVMHSTNVVTHVDERYTEERLMHVDENHSEKRSEHVSEEDGSKNPHVQVTSPFTLYVRILESFWGCNGHCLSDNDRTREQACTQNKEKASPDMTGDHAKDKRDAQSIFDAIITRDNTERLVDDEELHPFDRSDMQYKKNAKQACQRIEQVKTRLRTFIISGDKVVKESMGIFSWNIDNLLLFELINNFRRNNIDDMEELIRQRNMLIEILTLNNFCRNTFVGSCFKSLFVNQAYIFANHELGHKLAIFPEFSWLSDIIGKTDVKQLKHKTADLVVAFYVMGKFEQFMEAIVLEYNCMRKKDMNNDYSTRKKVINGSDNAFRVESVIKRTKTVNNGINMENDGKQAFSDKKDDDVKGKGCRAGHSTGEYMCPAEYEECTVNESHNEELIKKYEQDTNDQAVHENAQTHIIYFLTQNQNLNKLFVREFFMLYLINLFLSDSYFMMAYENITRLSFDYFCRRGGYKIVLNKTSDSFYDFMFFNLMIIVPTLHHCNIIDRLVKMNNTPYLPEEFKKAYTDMLKNSVLASKICTKVRNNLVGTESPVIGASYHEQMENMYTSRMFVYADKITYELLVHAFNLDYDLRGRSRPNKFF